jgi:hypothetical protein
VFVTLSALTVASAEAQTTTSRLHGALTSGPHGVGFTTFRIADPTRPHGPKRDLSGAAITTDRSRVLDVHLWYPAAGTAGTVMTFADYMTAHLSGDDVQAVRERDAAVRTFIGRFGPLTDDAWVGLKQTTLLARRDGPAAPGRYPLVIGMLRPLSTTLTNEYLASHGYVVAMVDGEEARNYTDAGPALEEGVRDMEFAIAALRARPNVDAASLAALGFSGSGFSQILLAMRHPDVDAVCDLESAIFDDRVMFALKHGWGYDLGALRVPFLHTYSVPLSKLENTIADFEGMRYSTRYRYLVEAPGIHHWDFATEGMAASTLPGVRGDAAPRLRAAFETTNRYVLAFFNAYVKGDAAELAFLRRDPASNGAPAGLATIRELPAIEPAPTSDAFAAAIASRGFAPAMQELRAARVRDPQAPVFREATLNGVGYRLLRASKTDDAVALFRAIVEFYPGSSNAYDSLSEALEASGARAEAVEVCRKGLEVLAKQDVTPQGRAQMAELLEGRITRLQ